MSGLGSTGPVVTTPATVQDLASAYRAGTVGPVAELQACLARIGALDGQLGAVLTTDPGALDAARASARRLRAGRARSALEGVPVLVRDNIETAAQATTAGSRLLNDVPAPPADAPLVVRLRRAGAVVVGKANLSEWSNFRSTSSTSGWSGVGGQTRNPHVLDRDPSGSSSGSAAAVAAGFTPVAVGTETDGSILSPGAHCGIVGVKPTLGLVSRTGIVPISAAQDTAGPLARTVTDAALLLTAIAGVDRSDPATTTAAVGRARREVQALVAGGSLERTESVGGAGRRLAVWRGAGETGTGRTAEVFDDVVRRLRDQGFVPVEVTGPPTAMVSDAWTALLSEFRSDLDGYLAGRPGAPADLAAVVAGNEADPLELSRFGQELMVAALAAPPADDPAVLGARRRARSAALEWVDSWAGGPDGCIACVAPAGPAALPLRWADSHGGSAGAADDSGVPTAGGVTVTTVGASSPAAVGGTPSLTLPVGLDGPLPLGLVVLGRPFGDADLLALAREFELSVGHRVDPALLPHAP